ncbi:hypothetical protein ACPZ19_19405 [Amycolatopsis lurida]
MDSEQDEARAGALTHRQSLMTNRNRRARRNSDLTHPQTNRTRATNEGTSQTPLPTPFHSQKHGEDADVKASFPP